MISRCLRRYPRFQQTENQQQENSFQRDLTIWYFYPIHIISILASDYQINL